jgi:hypothetical protein
LNAGRDDRAGDGALEGDYIARGESGAKGPSGDDPRLAHVALLAHLLDRAFVVPGTRWRFGIEALIGLIPGLGDLVGSLLGTYAVYIARELGAPASIQARMVMNLVIDGVVGLVPFAGDLFDFAFKAHSRNHALLVRWLETPHQTQRSSALWLVVGAVAMLGIAGAAGWVLVSVFRWLFG